MSGCLQLDRIAVAVALGVVSCSLVVDAQVPVGDEIQISTGSSYTPTQPAIASDAAGNFVVVWADDSSAEILGRRFANDGTPLDAAEFVVASTGAGNPLRPDVAMNAGGDFVVVWQDTDEIFGRRFSSTGIPLEAAYEMSHEPPSGSSWTYLRPAVAVAASGGFVIAYHRTGDGSATYLRAFDDSGTAVSDGVLVSSGESDDSVDLAVSPFGPAVVVWHQEEVIPGKRQGPEVAMRVFSLAGVSQGSEAVVGSGLRPLVAAIDSGGFALVWHSSARFLDATGAPSGGDILLGGVDATAVAGISGGGFVAVDESSGQVIGRDGTPLGDTFNLRDSDSFLRARVAALRGGFVVAGEGEQPARDFSFGIGARRFRSPPGPAFAFFPMRGFPSPPPSVNRPNTGTLGAADQVDIDDDGENEIIVNDFGRSAGSLAARNSDGDGDLDVVFVGVDGGGAFFGGADLDGDGEREVIVSDPARTANTVVGRNADGDGDLDAVFVSTFGGGAILGSFDMDDDAEPELIVSSPTLVAQSVTSRNFDGDGDLDVVFVGSSATTPVLYADLDDDGEAEAIVESAAVGVSAVSSNADGDGDLDVVFISGALLAGVVDLDGDLEPEVAAEDTTGSPGSSLTINIDGDGDLDVVAVGSVAGSAVAYGDLDGDFEYELVVEDPTAGAHGTDTQNMDGDGDIDVVFVATPGGGAVFGALDPDGDDEIEVIVVETAGSEGATSGSSVDGDGDSDIIFLGSGGADPAFSIDLDDDPEVELLLCSATTAAGITSTYDLSGGIGMDVCFVGTGGGGQVAGTYSPNSGGRAVPVVEAEGLAAATASGVDLIDDDPWVDVVFVSAANGAQTVVSANPDDDASDELVIEDPVLAMAAVAVRDVDGGSDGDVFFLGNGASGRVALAIDLDGDQEQEIVIEDPALAPGLTFSSQIAPPDGDSDVVRVGTDGGGSVHGGCDLDGDAEEEIVGTSGLHNPGAVLARHAGDGDGDLDLVLLGVAGGGVLKGVADLDGDGEPDVVVWDPSTASGSVRSRNTDGDGDLDVVFVGTGGASLITVISPNEPTTWLVGESRDISWEAPTLAGEITIELSRDGGTTFEVLVAATANNGHWTWAVSGAPASAAVVRVSSALAPSVFDENDQTFIIGTPSEVFSDGFESGTVLQWSSSVGGPIS